METHPAYLLPLTSMQPCLRLERCITWLYVFTAVLYGVPFNFILRNSRGKPRLLMRRLLQNKRSLLLAA